MKIKHLSLENSILNTFLFEIRDKKIQKDSLRFRRNIERIGEILSYELSKVLNYKTKEVETPLGTKNTQILNEDLVICSILRAGLPLHNGILNYFDTSENAFVSAYRKHKANTNEFEIVVEYLASPNLEGKTLILADPMLATGQSILSTLNALETYGTPKNTHILTIIGAKKGIDLVEKHVSKETTLWIVDIDNTLNEKGYILPGLGDAGDLAYGNKL